MIKENIHYAGTEDRYKIWEKEKMEVVNALDELGMPSMQKLEKNELTPNEIVDIDNQALKEKDCPNIVFGRPHAGEYIPESLWSRTTDESKKSLAMIDRGTDFVYRSEKIPSVGTKISRLIIDPNRAPLLSINPSNPKAIGKVLWYKGIFDEEIYKKNEEPSEEEVEKLVEKVYLPYYNAMMSTIGSITDRRENNNERVLVIDGHSFPTNKDFKVIWDNYKIENPKKLPLFIIGDRDGESCDEDIRNAFLEKLENNFDELDDDDKEMLLRQSESKRIVGANEYLKGVHNVQFFGQRKEGVNSIQLEINESMFMNDKDDNYYDTEYNQKALEIVQKLIEKTCLDIDPILKNK